MTPQLTSRSETAPDPGANEARDRGVKRRTLRQAGTEVRALGGRLRDTPDPPPEVCTVRGAALSARPVLALLAPLLLGTCALLLSPTVLTAWALVALLAVVERSARDLADPLS